MKELTGIGSVYKAAAIFGKPCPWNSQNVQNAVVHGVAVNGNDVTGSDTILVSIVAVRFRWNCSVAQSSFTCYWLCSLCSIWHVLYQELIWRANFYGINLEVWKYFTIGVFFFYVACVITYPMWWGEDVVDRHIELDFYQVAYRAVFVCLKYERQFNLVSVILLCEVWWSPKALVLFGGRGITLDTCVYISVCTLLLNEHYELV